MFVLHGLRNALNNLCAVCVDFGCSTQYRGHKRDERQAPTRRGPFNGSHQFLSWFSSLVCARREVKQTQEAGGGSSNLVPRSLAAHGTQQSNRPKPEREANTPGRLPSPAAGLVAAGVSHDDPTEPTLPHDIQREDPKRRKNTRQFGRQRGRKERHFRPLWEGGVLKRGLGKRLAVFRCRNTGFLRAPSRPGKTLVFFSFAWCVLCTLGFCGVVTSCVA